MVLKLQIMGIPFSKQSFRFATIAGHVHKYQPKKVVDAEANVQSQVIQQLPEGFKPWTGKVFVNKMWFHFPALKSMTKKQKSFIESGGMIYKSTKPDLTDNLAKGLFDAMAGIVYVNDAQVCQMGNIRKVFSAIPQIYIEMEEYLGNEMDLEIF
jgi:Holliday junction resolvase RusA-like endonuclease